MTIKNVIISTETKYQDNGEDGYLSRSTPYDVIQLDILIPQGKASFEIKITKELRDALDLASGLQK